MEFKAEKIVKHEIADSLDSSQAFEGPEKTLRLYFKSAGNFKNGLLDVPREEWEAMLELVKCKVLSVVIHPQVHAYVLSESSLFIYPDSLLLKTCGTTTLLEGLPAILDIVTRRSSTLNVLPDANAVIYSRRSYFNPDKQPHPHSCWNDEVHRLKNVFNGPAFASHFGVNRDERWHLFTQCSSAYASASANRNAKSDSRLSKGWMELMMTDLDPDLASRFHSHRPVDGFGPSMEDSVVSLDSVDSQCSSVGAIPDDDEPGHMLGNVMTRTTQIDGIYRTSKQIIDSFAFSPCGYSCNGLLLDQGDCFTIHVTPERGWSYASFETNVANPGTVEPGLTQQTVVERVLTLFEPAKFTLVTCSSEREKVVDAATLFGGGKYVCTSEAHFDTGDVELLQMTFTLV